MSAESNSRCPVCRTADVVCGKWTLLIVRDLSEGRSRFCELERSLGAIERFKERAGHLLVQGGRAYNPGWHLALDLRNMLLVSESIAKAALARTESRGGHTRDDFPGPDEVWATKNLVVSLNADGTGVDLAEKPLPVMPDELKEFFQ